MTLRECDLYPSVKKWLNDQGLTVYPEMLGIDVVGSDGTKIVIVEMKKCLSEGVMRQASRGRYYSGHCYAAVGSNPSAASLKVAKDYWGIGVMRVHADRVEVILEPNVDQFTSQGWSWAAKILKRLATHPTTGGAGHPCGKGKSPRKECNKRVLKFLKKNPNATWREIFDSVKNHYSSPSALRSCMGIDHNPPKKLPAGKPVLRPEGN